MSLYQWHQLYSNIASKLSQPCQLLQHLLATCDRAVKETHQGRTSRRHVNSDHGARGCGTVISHEIHIMHEHLWRAMDMHGDEFARREAWPNTAMVSPAAAISLSDL
jgi:hypothetical protein